LHSSSFSVLTVYFSFFIRAFADCPAVCSSCELSCPLGNGKSGPSSKSIASHYAYCRSWKTPVVWNCRSRMRELAVKESERRQRPSRWLYCSLRSIVFPPGVYVVVAPPNRRRTNLLFFLPPEIFFRRLYYIRERCSSQCPSHSLPNQRRVSRAAAARFLIPIVSNPT